MNINEIPKQYDPKDAQDRWYPFWFKNGYFHADPSQRQAAVLHRDPAAERHRGLAPGARAQQHASGRPDSMAADARVRLPLDARHRPRRDRHAGGRRAPAARGREAHAPRRRPRGARRQDLGLEGRVREAHPRPASADGLLVRLGADPVHARRGLLAGRPPDVLQPVQGGEDLPRQAARELGHPASDGRRRRRDLLRGGQRPPLDHQIPGGRLRPTCSTSPPPAPRRCSATRPSPSTPTTPGIST